MRMSGGPRWASIAPSASCTSPWTSDCGMHEHVDPLVGHAEQVVGLHQLEPLVHQRGGVDRDLAPHRPRGVGQRLLDGHVLELRAGAAAEGAAAGGDRQPLRPPPGAGRRSAGAGRCARSPPGRSGRSVASARAVTSSPPTTSDSLLASARSIPSPSAATVGPRPAEPTSAFRTRSASDSTTSRTSPSGPPGPGPRSTPPRPGPRRPRRPARSGCTPNALGLLDQRLPRALGGEPHQLELVAAGADVERLGADRAGRAENQQALARGHRGHDPTATIGISRFGPRSAGQRIDRDGGRPVRAAVKGASLRAGPRPGTARPSAGGALEPARHRLGARRAGGRACPPPPAPRRRRPAACSPRRRSRPPSPLRRKWSSPASGQYPITGATFDHWATVARKSAGPNTPRKHHAKSPPVPVGETIKEVMGFLISSDWVIGEAAQLGISLSEATVRRQLRPHPPPSSSPTAGNSGGSCAAAARRSPTCCCACA